MLWPNLNSPDDLWKKLDNVKDCAIVWIVKFLRATQWWEGQMKRGCEFYLIELKLLNLAYVLWPNFNSPDVLWNKLDSVKMNGQILRATQGWEKQNGLWIVFFL